MKPVGIITDSCSGISQKEASERGIFVLPMPFYVEGQCLYEGVDLDRDDFMEKLRTGADVSTSQPSPAEVTALWDQALSEYEKVLYMPISSGLSGSCETAYALTRDERYEGRVLVVDHGQVATPLHRMVLDALELVEKGYTAEEIRELLERASDQMMIYIGVQTLEYLKKGGRITPAAAALGSVFNIKPVLKLATGKLDSFKKCHGFLKARKAMIEAMKHEIETRFQDAYEAGAVHILAASSASEAETESWVKEIEAAFPGKQVMCDPSSLGVSCHIGPGGLGIGCAVEPGITERSARKRDEYACRAENRCPKNGVGRMAFVILSVLIQAGWILLIVLRLNRYSWLIALISTIAAMVVVLRIYASREDSAYKILWIMLDPGGSCHGDCAVCF